MDFLIPWPCKRVWGGQQVKEVLSEIPQLFVGDVQRVGENTIRIALQQYLSSLRMRVQREKHTPMFINTCSNSQKLPNSVDSEARSCTDRLGCKKLHKIKSLTPSYGVVKKFLQHSVNSNFWWVLCMLFFFFFLNMRESGKFMCWENWWNYLIIVHDKFVIFPHLVPIWLKMLPQHVNWEWLKVCVSPPSEKIAWFYRVDPLKILLVTPYNIQGWNVL